LPVPDSGANFKRGDVRAVIERETAGPEAGGIMLYWTLVFLVIALIAGLLGFGAIAFVAAGVARVLFFIFLVLFVISLLSHTMRRA
jgi:uncharacterized membrane protein YtjA (UPF0391 family)